MFFLKELPTRQMLEGYHQRFPSMNVEAVEGALHLLRDASVLLRALEAYFAEHQLSQVRFLVLVVLDREPELDGLMASEVASRLDISRPLMTRTLHALEQDGLVSSTGHQQDGRVRVVRLTSKGSRLLERVLPGYYQIIEAFMHQRSPPAEKTPVKEERNAGRRS
ncbi:MarR family winged helix-turn-helix transcriptional regulator [Myxococcus sp. Y35]|uniref:MarR family winged helix-turn-helix transcriptional regulator n=1 Tax=Pseudomyxococcus flavus TaxID=3115648 RepID=UPI003CEE23AA